MYKLLWTPLPDMLYIRLLMWRVDSIFVPPVVVPRHYLSTYGRRSFAVAGPAAWNSLRVTICVIRHFALTVSDVFSRLVCFQSTSTFSALGPRGITQYALYKFTTYLLTEM